MKIKTNGGAELVNAADCEFQLISSIQQRTQ
jgi:hypothetical protein